MTTDTLSLRDRLRAALHGIVEDFRRRAVLEHEDAEQCERLDAAGICCHSRAAQTWDAAANVAEAALREGGQER